MIADSEFALYEVIEGLHRNWVPLPWQVPVGHALFYKRMKNIGAKCGRSAGKTDIAGYCSWRYAMENPGSENYIFEPLQKQAKEILWAPGRIQNFGPKEWLHGEPNNTEMRIRFKNGSFIKIDGSDNVDALRGIKPKGLIIYDELKDHKKAFIDAMEPNRARYDAPALYLGTPPEFHNHYVDIMNSLADDKDSLLVTATSFDNIHNSRSFLEKVRAKLVEKGEEDTWLREYMAIFVKGGKRSIFPQVLKMRFPSFEEIKPKDLNKWTLIVSFDPASTSVFGVIFILFNPYTKQSIAFNELYIDEPAKMTARAVYDAVSEILEPFKGRVREISFAYDEAAAWFRNELSEIDSRWWLIPSDKSKFGVDGYINLFRAIMNKNLLTICSECPKLIWEMESYIKDEKGKIPKKDDHLINASQYAFSALGLNLEELEEPVIIPKEEPRGYRIEDDLIVNDSYAEID